MNYSMIRLGSQCAAARKLKGVSLRKMQELTGYNKNRLSRFENGKFDEDIFLMYYPFWNEWYKLYCTEQRPSDTMKEIKDFDSYFATKPQYCIYSKSDEEKYMKLTGHSCLEDYWQLKDHISRLSEKIRRNEFTR